MNKIQVKIMNKIQVKILDKRVELPTKATNGSAGFDLQAAITEPLVLLAGESKLVPTGLAIHIDNTSHVAFILPRSKKGSKEGVVVGNLTGVIDSDYQGQWFISVWNRNFNNPVEIKPLDKIAQVVFLKLADVDFETVEEFEEETERGDGGISQENDTVSNVKITIKEGFKCIICESQTFRKFYSTKSMECDSCGELYHMDDLQIKHQRG